MNGPVFLAYVEQFLVSALRPGDVVTIENAAAQKVAGAEHAVRTFGASPLYLRPILLI